MAMKTAEDYSKTGEKVSVIAATVFGSLFMNDVHIVDKRKPNNPMEALYLYKGENFVGRVVAEHIVIDKVVGGPTLEICEPTV